MIGSAAWDTPQRKVNVCNFVFDENSFTAQLSIFVRIKIFLFPFLFLILFNFFWIMWSIEGKKCQEKLSLSKVFCQVFFAPHSWRLLHFHIVHGGLLTFSSVLNCVGTVDCTIFKSCRFIETAKILIRSWTFDANHETYKNFCLFDWCKTIQPRTFHCNSIFWITKSCCMEQSDAYST